MLETEELISEIGSHHILQLNGVLAIWPHKGAGKWSVDVLYSAAYTFIDICRAIPATKLLSTSSYKLGSYRYGWGSRKFRNIIGDSIYMLIRGWLNMTQLYF